MNALAGFYKQHAEHARLVKVYPEAEVVRDSLPWSLVSAYCDTFEGEELPATCNESLRDKARTHYARACAVATGVKRIAWPVACAEACHVAAYATLKCEQLYLEQSWHRSMLTSVQREFKPSGSASLYPKIDFAFWVKYGSWSFCPSCGSYHFNDKYFSQEVYQYQTTSTSPDLWRHTGGRCPALPWSTLISKSA